MKRIAFICVLGLNLFFTCSIAFSETTLEISHWWTSKGESKAIHVIKKAFEEKGFHWNDYSIEGGAGHKMMPILKAKVADGSSPDAVQVYIGPNTWALAEEGFLINLNDIASKGSWHKILPGVIDHMIRYNGDYVAVPFNAHRVNYMWINPEIFKKSNAKIPTSWDEFFIEAEKIKKAGFIPLALGGQAWQEATLFECVLLNIGGKSFHHKAFIEYDLHTLKSDTMLTVFQTMRKIKQYIDSDSNGRSWDDTTSMVMKEKAAMQIMGDWAKGEFLASGKKPGIDFICKPAPGTDDLFLMDTDTFVFFKSNDKKIQDAQQALAEIIISKEIQKQFNQLKGSIPARLDIPSNDFDACACESMTDFSKAATLDNIIPSMAYYQSCHSKLTEIIINLISTFFNSTMSEKEAVLKLTAIIMADM